jgi:hypothetical protein
MNEKSLKNLLENILEEENNVNNLNDDEINKTEIKGEEWEEEDFVSSFIKNKIIPAFNRAKTLTIGENIKVYSLEEFTKIFKTITSNVEEYNKFEILLSEEKYKIYRKKLAREINRFSMNSEVPYIPIANEYKFIKYLYKFLSSFDSFFKTNSIITIGRPKFFNIRDRVYIFNYDNLWGNFVEMIVLEQSPVREEIEKFTPLPFDYSDLYYNPIDIRYQYVFFNKYSPYSKKYVKEEFKENITLEEASYEAIKFLSEE